MFKNYVIDFYDNYGYEFDTTRQNHIWKLVKEHMKNYNPYDIVLDVGGGNGKNCKNTAIPLHYQMCDISDTMCNISHKKGIDVVQCNALFLPYKRNTFNHVISIACVHHLPTFESRHKLLMQCMNVLKQNGTFFFSVWKNNEKYKGDSYIKWKTNEVLRFYHMYSYEELLQHMDLLKLDEIEYEIKYEISEDAQNFYVCVLKTK